LESVKIDLIFTVQKQSTMSKALQALTFINENLALGKTIYLQTIYQTIMITPATAAKFEKSKHKLFIIDSEGSLRRARGKHYDIIVTKNHSFVKITAI
jgi:hypothetical protein